jgi:hypothetical protein
MLSSVKYREHKINFRIDFWAQLQNETINLILSVHLPVHMEKSDSHWTDFHKISYFGVPTLCEDPILNKMNKNKHFT